MRFTGTWTLGQQVNGWARVLVHLPDHGAQTQQAEYKINTKSGWRTRYLNQGRNKNAWVSLGVYQFDGAPQVRLSNQTKDGFGDEDVAFDAVAFQKLPGKPRHIVAALGDSFSSGEGAGDYYLETDANHGTPRWNACRRSANAWPRKMTLPGTGSSLGTLTDNWSSAAELGFVACSGAWNHHITGWIPNSWSSPGDYHTGEGEFREVNQIDSGVLNEDTTLVTLTIGGNDDWIFINAMKDCSGLGDCSRNLLSKYKPDIDRSVSSARETVQMIRSKAKNAQIVLVGYPELLSRTQKCVGSLYVDPPEAQALGDLVGYGTGEQKKMVGGLGDQKISFLDGVVKKFENHSGCADDEWINKIVNGPNGDGDFHQGDKPTPLCITNGTFCLSRESFHPNKGGTTAYAELITGFLPSTGTRR